MLTKTKETTDIAWQKILKESEWHLRRMGLRPNMRIPPERGGYDRLLVVPKGMTPSKALTICSRVIGISAEVVLRKKEQFDNPDTVVEPRSAEARSYLVRHRGGHDSDEKWRELSYNSLKESNVSFLTLTETLLYIAQYFMEQSDCHLSPKFLGLGADIASDGTGILCNACDKSGDVWSVRIGRHLIQMMGYLELDIRRYKPVDTPDHVWAREVVL